MSNNSFSLNGAVAPGLAGDLAVGPAVFTGDVQLANGSYVNFNVSPTVVVPATLTLGDSLAQIQFFSADGGLGNAYAGQQGTSVGITGTAYLGVTSSTTVSTYIINPTALATNTVIGGYTVPQVVQCLINYGLLVGTSTLGTN